MFKNKILVKATLSPPSSSFFLLPLSFPSSPYAADPSLSVELEILSWKLSRKWRVACLVQPLEILIVYQKSQSDLVDRVVSEFLKFDSSIIIGPQEEVKSGSLIANAIEVGLKCLMLDNKWTCLGENTFVKSTFSTSEERANVYAVNVQVQSGASEEVIFLVSPETVRFSRYQILDLISSKNVDKFENKKEVILEGWNVSTACTALPSLFEGYVIGVSKVLPEGSFANNLQEDLWSVKHGLILKSDHYIGVQSLYGGFMNTTWFPSSFVLRGSGLTPAPKSIRVPQAILAFQSFTSLLKAWDFFGGALVISKVCFLSLSYKEQSMIDNCAVSFSWEKVTHNLPQHIINTDFISKDLLSALDFRTPKPAVGYSTEKIMDVNRENSLLLTDIDSKDAPSSRNEVQIGLNNVTVLKGSLPDKGQIPLLVPAFTKITRKPATNSSASIRLKGENAQVKAIQDNCQGTARSQKNETILVSGPNDCPFKTQTSAGAARADKHAVSVQHNSSSTSMRPVKSTKKNVAAVDNKFTTDGQIDAPTKKSWNKNKKILEVGEEGLEAVKTKQSSYRKETASECGMDALGSNIPDYIKAVQKTDVPVKKIQSQKNEASTEDYTKAKTKVKPKQALDKDEVTTKVLNCHKRGQLQSLTVAELKCFLSCKKAKVGGTKEELICRANDFLH